jgi:tripartite ATP-independent transporter DctP family solute receptor
LSREGRREQNPFDMTAPTTTRRRFAQVSAAAAASSFFIGRAKAADPIVLKLATVAPTGTPWEADVKAEKKRVAEASGGLIKIKPYFGGALGPEVETAEAVKRGTIDIFAGSTGALASVVPELDGLELPFLFKNVATADKVLDEVILEDVKNILLSRGLVFGFWGENGWRSIGSTFPISSLADLKGKKMRSQENQTHIDTWKAFGASPVPIAITETLSSLQTGVVDGFDNTPLFTFASSLSQATAYFTLTEHIYQPGIVCMSKKTYDKLPAELQAVLFQDPAKLAKRSRRGVRAMSPQLIENFKNAGIKVQELSNADKASFATAAAVVHASFLKRANKESKALLDKIRKAL